MGLEIGAAVMAAIAVGATGARMSAESKAAQADISAINQQSQLTQLQYQQKTMQNLELIDKMLSKQAAQLSTRGVAFDSPSFNAIQRETINAGSRKSKNLDTENTLAQQSYDIEKRNVKDTLHAQLFGDAANLAFGTLGVIDKWPTKGSGTTGKLPQIEDL